MDDLTVKYIRTAIKTSRVFHCLPFELHSETGQIAFDPSLKKKLPFLLQMVLFWSYLICLSTLALYVIYYDVERVSTSRKTEIQYVAVGYLIVLPFQLCSLVYYGRHHALINRYLLAFGRV